MTSDYQAIRDLLQANYLVFRALGDKQRQEVLFHLSESPNITVGELTAMMTLSRPAVSHHIKVLKQAGLLSEQKRGVRMYYSPRLKPSLGAMKQLSSHVSAIESEII
ncbi:MAG: metalloregulator ArsR/SmtB family transcription factor [bacterium]|nr:metalloregulator ArsR/SmtB family transcription factor [bacterium]MDN5835390.1 metalloregulator ArsR/SmtB family transcription factor [bacterium]